jgi:hypothetical protein
VYGGRLIWRDTKIKFEVSNLPIEIVLIIPPGLAAATESRNVDVGVEGRVSNYLPSLSEIAINKNGRPPDSVTCNTSSAQFGINDIELTDNLCHVMKHDWI